MSGDNGNGRDPASASDPSVSWQGYSRDGELDLAANLEQAALAFREKFGYTPVETRWAGCVILAGPIGAISEPVPRSLTARAVDAQRAAVELTTAEARERAQQLALQLEV